MSAFTDAVQDALEGLDFAAGALSGCHECGLDERPCRACSATGYADGLTHATGTSGDECPTCGGGGREEVANGAGVTGQQVAEAEEGGFSWSPCDCCGSGLGGDRYPVHAWKRASMVSGMIGNTIIHMGVCQDCLLFLANGDEPEEQA